MSGCILLSYLTCIHTVSMHVYIQLALQCHQCSLTTFQPYICFVLYWIIIFHVDKGMMAPLKLFFETFGRPTADKNVSSHSNAYSCLPLSVECGSQICSRLTFIHYNPIITCHARKTRNRGISHWITVRQVH